MSRGRRYWFRVKRRRLGCGLPNSWRGWVFFLASLALLLMVAVRLMPRHPILFAVVLGTTTLLFVRVCYIKGEPLSGEPRKIG